MVLFCYRKFFKGRRLPAHPLEIHYQSLAALRLPLSIQCAHVVRQVVAHTALARIANLKERAPIARVAPEIPATHNSYNSYLVLISSMI